ncbi:MAG: hypothetical protein R3A44_20210 [Caldilineaceae bacterium]
MAEVSAAVHRSLRCFGCNAPLRLQRTAGHAVAMAEVSAAVHRSLR